MELDRQWPITLTEAECQDGAMALRTAHVLAVGLAHLHDCVRGVEYQMANRLQEKYGPNDRRTNFGSAPELDGVPIDLVECAFRWYAVSLCDFVRVVVFLGQLDEMSRRLYKSDVIGSVQAFRDKVAAHTAGFTMN